MNKNTLYSISIILLSLFFMSKQSNKFKKIKKHCLVLSVIGFIILVISHLIDYSSDTQNKTKTTLYLK